MRSVFRAVPALFLLFASIGVASPIQAMPILSISNGQLVGARNVEANGSLFDVTFADGSCSQLFSGCGSTADFPFTANFEVSGFLTALRDQVFLDSAAGNFDSDPSLTFGCEDGTRCNVLVPTFVRSSGLLLANGFSNGGGSSLDFFVFPRTSSSNDTSTASDAARTVFAVISEAAPFQGPQSFSVLEDPAGQIQPAALTPQAAVAVSEPRSALLLALGLVLIAFTRRRRQAMTA